MRCNVDLAGLDDVTATGQLNNHYIGTITAAGWKFIMKTEL